MKTIVMGKNVTETYEVVTCKRDDNGSFTGKPYIDTKNKKIDWEEICSYEGEPQLNDGWASTTIYISEDERVIVERTIFRADLGTHIQYTSKVLSEDNTNYEECKKELESAIREYNKYKIEHDEKAKAYCELHKLSFEETDYNELCRIVRCSAPEDYSAHVYINEDKYTWTSHGGNIPF